MRELMVYARSNDLRQRNAPWAQEARHLECPSHRCSAVLRRNTHDDWLAIFERSLKDVVMRACAEPAHFDRHAADGGGCQISRDEAVWRIHRQSRGTSS